MYSWAVPYNCLLLLQVEQLAEDVKRSKQGGVTIVHTGATK